MRLIHPNPQAEQTWYTLQAHLCRRVSHEQARPIIAGTDPPAQKVYHTNPIERKEYKEKPISDVYAVIDTDLARDNLENDITAADLQDL